MTRAYFKTVVWTHSRLLLRKSSVTFAERKATIAWLMLCFANSAVAGPVESLEDIQFWIGMGSNRAAIAIDWEGQDTNSSSLVWGYRWNGQATSADLLLAIVAADSRLYAKVGPLGGLGIAVYGIGYDASGDGQFALDDGTMFDDDGLAQSGPADLGQSADPLDFYREGWFLGYWHQGTAANEPTGWSTGPGVSARILVDQSWDSLAFTNDILDQSSFASGLTASEEMTLPGDYDRSGTVDNGDLTVWQNSVGQAVLIAGYGADGNNDLQIDGGDFLVWQRSFGTTLGDSGNTAGSLPEPTAMALAGLCCVLSFHFLRKRLV